MSIISLSDQDFYLAGRRSKTLNIHRGGFILVFFKMQDCKYCNSFGSIFQQLAQQDHRIQYAICDLTIHRKVAAMSKHTNSPIRTVPWLVFYSDQTPIAKISGFKQRATVLAFIGRGIQEAKARGQRQQVFMPHQQQQANMYGGYQQPQAPPKQPKFWKPDMKEPSAMKNAVRGTPQYSQMENQEEDDRNLIIPENVTPHNKPWEGEYRKMDSFE